MDHTSNDEDRFLAEQLAAVPDDLAKAFADKLTVCLGPGPERDSARLATALTDKWRRIYKPNHASKLRPMPGCENEMNFLLPTDVALRAMRFCALQESSTVDHRCSSGMIRGLHRMLTRIEHRLAEDLKLPRKQRHISKRMFDD